jgi:RNA polymerase sigma factor (sigma-70 family)
MKPPRPPTASTGAGVVRLLTDAQLARGAAKGDRRAFAAIYRRYGQSLFRYCLSILGRAEEAQDALQNTMVKALRALPGEQRRIQLKPWLYRVAHNESIELLRRRREDVELDPGLMPAGAEPAETAANRERLRCLLADLGELPERQRGALVMRELAGFDFAQIGEALDTSAAVARQTVFEARLNLRQLEAGREMSCEQVMWRLSEADGRTARRRDIQAHLRACPACREFRDSIATRREDLGALAPLPAATSAAVLHAVLGSGSTGLGGGGMAGAVGVAGKAAAGGTIAKSAATVAVVAAIGVSAADRGGLIDVGVGGDKGARNSPTARPVSPTPSPPPAAGLGSITETGKAPIERLDDQREAGPGRAANGIRAALAAEPEGARAPGSPPNPPPSTLRPSESTPSNHGRGAHSSPASSEQQAAKRHGRGRGNGNGARKGSGDTKGNRGRKESGGAAGGKGAKGGNGGKAGGNAKGDGDTKGNGRGQGHGQGKGNSGTPPGHTVPEAKPPHGAGGEQQPPSPTQPNGPPGEHVRPDKSHGTAFQQPTNPGAPEAGAHPPKEAG